MRLFCKLRGALLEHDIDQKYLAEKIGVCHVGISRRMTGKVSWQLDEMYTVLDLIGEPHERLHEYFPKGGRSLD